jgi:hypothetical protein
MWHIWLFHVASVVMVKQQDGDKKREKICIYRLTQLQFVCKPDYPEVCIGLCEEKCRTISINCELL